MYIGLHVKCTSLLLDINETGIFLDRSSKNIQIPNFMKNRPLGAELLSAEGRTDRYEGTNCRFSEYCESA